MLYYGLYCNAVSFMKTYHTNMQWCNIDKVFNEWGWIIAAASQGEVSGSLFSNIF